MNNRIWMVACALACLTTSAAWAAPVHMCDPVVVTAARVSQSVKDTPTPVTVVTREMLSARGATDLAQALEAVPGVTFHTDGMRRSHVTVRGTNSRHTLILVDGRSHRRRDQCHHQSTDGAVVGFARTDGQLPRRRAQ